MKIALVTPAAPSTRHGNRNTASRWAALAAQLGHRVAVRLSWDGAAADLLIALHARRSHESIARFAARLSRAPAGGGADRHRSLSGHPRERRGATIARTRRRASSSCRKWVSPSCPRALRAKARVIYQSARTVAAAAALDALLRSGGERPSARGKGSVPLRRRARATCRRRAASRVTHMGGAMSRRWRGKRCAGRRASRATAGSASCRTGRRCACWRAAG